LQLSNSNLYLELGLGHMEYSHVSLIDFYLHKKFCSNWKTFCGWMDRRELGQALLSRLLVDWT